MIEIGQNIFEHKLLGLFWGYEPKDKEDGLLYALLGRICRAWIVDRNREKNPEYELISSIRLNEDERELIEKYNLLKHQNLEVRTRCADVMIRFAKGCEKLDRMRQASDGYLELYKETINVFYFVRSIFVREVKLLYDVDFMEEVKRVLIRTKIHPGWLTDALNRVIINVEGGLENSYVKDILSAYTKVASAMDAHWCDSYWNMLSGIGVIDDKECHYQKALNWEKYADKIDANKKPNVLNANLHAIYQDAYNAIYLVRDDFQNDFRRIRDKYNAAKKDFVESLSLCGVRTKYEVPKEIIPIIQARVASINFNSVEETIISFLTIPFYTVWKKLIDKRVEEKIQDSDVIEMCFPQSQTLDNEGNVSGISDFEHDKHLQVHRFIRATQLYHILSLYERIGEHALDYSEELFCGILMENKPSFVEEDRVQLWAKAYYYYFNGDIAVASHLLMPQFENALHNLLEEKVEDVTMLNNDVQKEPTLKAVLRELKSYCNPVLYDELFMFFVDGNDVNYRNRLLHGLMDSFNMIRYGHYLFYLANLLYFNGKDFLVIGNHDTEGHLCVMDSKRLRNTKT